VSDDDDDHSAGLGCLGAVVGIVLLAAIFGAAYVAIGVLAMLAPSED
jgi:hypothetical protein